VKGSAAATTHQLRYVPSIGYEAGGPVMWWGDVAHDQRGSDAYSLVYDSEPLPPTRRSRLAARRYLRSAQTRRAQTGSCGSRTWHRTAR
jgi:hypothetical protein